MMLSFWVCSRIPLVCILSTLADQNYFQSCALCGFLSCFYLLLSTGFFPLFSHTFRSLLIYPGPGELNPRRQTSICPLCNFWWLFWPKLVFLLMFRSTSLLKDPTWFIIHLTLVSCRVMGTSRQTKAKNRLGMQPNTARWVGNMQV